MGKITFPEESLKPTLDSLLSDDLPISPPVEVEIGQASLTIAWKPLRRREIQKLKIAARKWAYDEVKAADLPAEEVNNAYFLDILVNEVELRMLHASMVDPNSKGGRGPAVSLKKLRETIKPGQQTKLNELWWVWQTAHDYDDLTEDQVESMIDAAGRGDRPFLLGLGSGGLVSSFISLAVRHETLKTANLPDGGSLESLSDDTSKEKGFLQNMNNLTEIYARISGMEVRIERNKSRIDDVRRDMRNQEKK
jgi:hypothetical protein